MLQGQERLGRGVNEITKLRKVRKALGLTQRRLAILSGVDRVSIARYETGRVSPNIRNLTKLADALGVPVDELVEKRKVG